MAKHEGYVYIVMEFVDGPTLEEWISTDPPPSRDAMLDVLRQIAAGLDHAHQKGVIHRDIKPMNIIIEHDGTPRITDFGLAKVATSFQLTQSGTQIGTPHYMSPEQAQGTHVDGRSDQFSLAVIAYRMFTGEKPFDADHITTLMFKIVYEEALPPQSRNPELAEPVNAVFRRALAKDPAERFSTCAEMVNALEAALNAPPAPRVTRKLFAASALPDTAVRKGVWIALAACLFVVIAAAVLFVRASTSSPPAPPAPSQSARPSPAAPREAPGILLVRAVPSTTTVTIRRADETVAKPVDGTRLELPRGTYVLSASAPGHATRSVTVQLSAGESETVELELSSKGRSVPVPTAPIIGGMADWERPNEWLAKGAWLVHKGGDFVLYGITPVTGSFSFTATLLRGRRLQWVLDFADSRSYALFQWRKISSWSRTSLMAINWNGQGCRSRAMSAGLDMLLLTVSATGIATRLYDGRQWSVLDQWEQPGRDFTDGKFGFLIPGSDEVGIADFQFTPKGR